MPPVETSTETQLILSEIADVKAIATENRDDIKRIDGYIRGNGNGGLWVEMAQFKQFRRAVCWIGCSLFTGVLVVLIVHLLLKQF